MTIKDMLGGLQVKSPRKQGGAKSESLRPNPMSSIISQSGQELRGRLQNLEEEIQRYRNMEKTGQVEVLIPIDTIERPDLVMRSDHYWHSDRYQEIKASIQHHGLQEPITVRPLDQDRYRLVKGDTRLNAYRDLLKETGDECWQTIRTRIEELPDDLALLKMVIENRDRQDVYPYDQSVFYRRVLEEVSQGDRAAAVALLEITDSWLSRNLTVSRLPYELMAAFPALYHAGVKALYPLAQSLEKNPDGLGALLDRRTHLHRDEAVGQVQQLMRALERPAPRKGRPVGGGVRRLTGHDGQLLAEISVNRYHRTLRIDTRKMPGFAELVEENLQQLYEQWRAENQKEVQKED